MKEIMKRVSPIYNFKYTNEAALFLNAGTSYLKTPEPTEIEDNGRCRIQKFNYDDIGVQVSVKETYFEDTAAVMQENEIRKTTDSALSLTEFSSALICGIEYESFDGMIVHYTDNMWQTECQWKRFTLEELGFHIGGNHGLACNKRFQGIGSRSTAYHYPMILLENTKTHKIYFMEIESSTSWMIEIGIRDDALYLECNCAYENFNDWNLMMKKGDSYKAVPAVVGCVDGGFNEAVNELLKYKRNVSKVSFKEHIPVVFNNYMNCIWENQKTEKILPLVDKAKEADVDIFCMDSGWYDFLGDWNIKEENFGDMKLQGIIDYIRNKGMKAGIWLEVETIAPDAKAFKKYYGGVYKRHGIPINEECKLTMDFRHKEFRKHIENVVDMLYKMGIRYIKNDYNKSTGIGIDGKECPSYELREASFAFYDFIKEMNKKYPDIIWENCASGGLRNDGGIMKYFPVASTSDLEYYYYYPSVMIGTNACIPMEKSGIWSYPYPALFSDISKKDEEIFTDEYRACRKDGRETVFNMVTSMFGCMYLSGRIDKCDDYNFSLIKEGVSVYKTFSYDIKKSLPVFFEYPVNTCDSYTTSFGLSFPHKNELLIGAWNYNGNKDYSIDLSKYTDKNSKAELLYPSNSKIEYKLENRKLNIVFDSNISACVIKVR